MNQANGLRFTFRVSDLPGDALGVVSFELEEELSSPFHLAVDLTTGDQIPDTSELLEKAAELTLWQQGEARRSIQGVITRVERLRNRPQLKSLRVTVEPSLARLRHMRNCRIFQQLGVADIIATLLEERGIQAFRFNLREEHPERAFCVQYRETDLHFLERLAAEEGISYRFDLEDGQPQLIFEDHLNNGPDLGLRPYEPNAGGTVLDPIIRRFSSGQQVAASSSALHHYDFQRPETRLFQREEARGLDAQRDQYPWYDHPGHFESDSQGKRLGRLRLEALRSNALTGEGSSQIAELRPGAAFSLDHDLVDEDQAHWRVIRVTHTGEQKQALENNADDGSTRYNNDFAAVPARTPWRPMPTPKPSITGPQNAFVTGPEGEEIHCDEHGRVRLRFPWDRSDTPDENSSAWVRVTHGWAGAGHGRLALPRVGDEVLVTFMDGDPDQPLVTGRVHHAQNVAPLNLPEEKTRTVWRTHTHQGEGANELSFDDRADNERIELQAAGNLHSAVRNDRVESIGNDSHLQVEGNQYRQTQGDHHQITDGDQLASVGGDTSLSVQGSIHLKAGNAWLSDAGTELHIKAGQKAVIEAGTELTLDAGGSFLKLDPSGVTLMGPTIKLNAGGAPGAGSGQQAEAAEAPLQLDPKSLDHADPKELPQNDQRPPFSGTVDDRLDVAITERESAVEGCQRQPDDSCPLDDCPCNRAREA